MMSEKQTPLQELKEWVLTELKLEGYEHNVIEDKVESLLKKEKEVMIKFSGAYHSYIYGLDNLTMDGYPIPPKPEEELNISDFYDKHFNTKEK